MLRPIRDRLLVRPLERKASDTVVVVSSEKFSLGEVVATGPKVEDVKAGDRIRFGTDEGYLNYPEWQAETGERFIVLQEADVCFVEG